MNRMYSRVALLFFIAAASCSSHANAVELDAFPCTDDENGKRRYEKEDDLYVCVNPTRDYASNYKITTLKGVTCEGLYGDNYSVIVIGAGGEVRSGQDRLESESLIEFKGHGEKKAAPNGMGFRTKAYPEFFNKGNRRVVCQGTAEVEYTEPCEQQTYTLPTTESDSDENLVHGGFCVVGAKDATASVSINGADYVGLTYTRISELSDGTKVWGDKPDEFAQLQGNVCEGGLFLQPSKKKGLPLGADVTIETTEEDGKSEGVTICAFVEPPFVGVDNEYYDRGGKWMQQLLEQGFEDKGYISYSQYLPDRILVLCKLMSESCEENNRRGRGLAAIEEELDFEADVDIGNECPADIVLRKSDGVTPYPGDGDSDPPVNIVSQETERVTVEVKNTWGEPIEKIFYSYKTSLWNRECFEEIGVDYGEDIEDIIIQCKIMSPVAFLTICLQDSNLLVEGDNAQVSPCCYPENIEDPTVCYHLEIKCENTCIEEDGRRRLRAIAA